MHLAEKIKHNSGLMLIICCGIPLVALLIAVNYFGLSRSYLFLFMLLLCPIMHYFMMKKMQKDKGSKRNKTGGCH